MKKLGILLVHLCALTLLSSKAQINQDSLDQYIQHQVNEYDLAGLSISLVKEGAVDFEKAYGFAHTENKVALSTNSVFGIASLSKAFTSVAIGMLVDEGKISWDDRVSQYIDAFQLSNDQVAAQLTIEDLLAHRSGYSTFDGDLLWYGTNYSTKEIIRRFAQYPMSYDFRTTYGYQNIMFIIAGEIVGKVSGTSWEEFVITRIFDPLEMNNSFTSVDQYTDELSIAYPYVKGSVDQIRNYDNSGAAAAISSNVEDLSKWIRFWLNEGIVNEDTLLSEASVRRILSLQTPIEPSGFERSNGVNFKGYGLGWFLMDYQDGKLAQHGGGLPGYISKIFLYPELDFGGVILTNGESSLPTALMYHIIDQYKGKKVRENWAALYLKFSNNYQKGLDQELIERENKRKKQIKSQFKQSELEGIYEDKVYGKASVSQKGDKLMFSMIPSKEIFTSPMDHWHFNTFKVKFRDQFLPAGYITFSQNSDGEVSGLTIDLPNPDFHFHKLDFKKIE